jgi:hypothetical protein
MGTRIAIISYDDLEKTARGTFLDGIISGQKLADTVGSILMLASAWGGDEAERSKYFAASVDAPSYDDLKREALGWVVDHMFKSGLDTMIRQLVLMGAAFGFQNVKAKQAVAA